MLRLLPKLGLKVIGRVLLERLRRLGLWATRDVRETILRWYFGRLRADMSHLEMLFHGSKPSVDVTQGLESQIVALGDKVLAGSIPLLGYGWASIGRDPDWHRDPVTGASWPVTHFSRIRLGDRFGKGDVRLVWELSRLGFLVRLAQAYYVSQDRKYLEGFIGYIDHWMLHNPFEMGTNWTTAMEVAVRAINVTLAYGLFSRAGAEFSDEEKSRIAIFLGLHGHFIRSNLERGTRNNHYLTNLAGLIAVGAALRDSPLGRRWFKFGLRRFVREQGFQMNPDGVHYEASVAYHCLVTELVLLVVMLGRQCAPTRSPSRRFVAELEERLSRMLRFVLAMRKENGSLPSIGDDDGSRVFSFSLDETSTESRDELLVLAVRYLGSEPSKLSLGAQDSQFWFGYARHADDRRSLDAGPSYSFSNSGFYVWKSGPVHLVVRCGDIGRRGRGGHGHNDQLSFTLAFGRSDVFVDPGTYTYTGDLDARHYFRSTKTHNTVCIDDAEQNDIYREYPFRMDERTYSTCLCWESTQEECYFEGLHRGYANRGVIVRRSIWARNSERLLRVTDKIEESGGARWHEAVIRFHLAPDIALSQASGSELILKIPAGPTLRMVYSRELLMDVEQGYYSPRYGMLTPTSVVTFVARNLQMWEFGVLFQ